MKPLLRAALVLLAVAALAACGDDDATVNSNADAPANDPAAGACREGSTDCDDTPTTPADDDSGAVDEHAAIEEAKALVGVAEDELDPSVRVSRRGDEQYAVTEDYRIGRMTVELDPDDQGTMRVTKVVLELTEGPMTFPES